MVLRMIGKKLTVVPIAILDGGPSPKPRMKSGRNRIIGTEYMPANKGSNTRMEYCERLMR